MTSPFASATAVLAVLVFLMMSLAGLAMAHTNVTLMTGQHARSLHREIRTTLQLQYLLYLPEAYVDSTNTWPLLLFLHGAGERGNDLNKVKVHGPPKLVGQGSNHFPFVIASPQCPAEDWWTSDLQVATLDALLDDIVDSYRIDEDRVYVTGLSMGGFGTWHLACEYPERFAAIAPVCGGGEPGLAPRIAHLPVWAFHGGKDTVVPPEQSQAMVAALKDAGGEPTLTIYPEAGHDSWTATYANPALYEWLLAHNRMAHAQPGN
jgi:predicted peptidase